MTVNELIGVLSKIPNQNMEILSTYIQDDATRGCVPFTRISIEVNDVTGSRILLENYQYESTYEILDKIKLSEPVEKNEVLWSF